GVRALSSRSRLARQSIRTHRCKPPTPRLAAREWLAVPYDNSYARNAQPGLRPTTVVCALVWRQLFAQQNTVAHVAQHLAMMLMAHPTNSARGRRSCGDTDSFHS